MKGNVIGFDPESNTGAISGYDGKRYDFATVDWHGQQRPRHGDVVDFVPDGQHAAQVYLIEPQHVGPTLLQFYLSPSGRISRSQYWLRYVVPVIVIGLVLSGMFGTARVIGNYGLAGLIETLHKIFALLALWPGIAVLVKRIHDRDKSGWLVVLPSAMVVLMLLGIVAGFAADSIPAAVTLAVAFGAALVGIAIWFFVEFGCMRGTVGPNRHGPDPLGAR
jgi:uncharacterized membrane protein YhaH (DUF805 family)